MLMSKLPVANAMPPKNQVNFANKIGKRKLLIPLVFPTGSSSLVWTFPNNERIENVESINVKEYSITLAPNGGGFLPSKVNLCATPAFFKQNLLQEDNVDTDGIPLVLQNPFLMPNGLYNYTVSYGDGYQCSKNSPGASKGCPASIVFSLSSSTYQSGVVPGALPGNSAPQGRLTVAAETCILLEMCVYAKTVEDWRNRLMDIPRPYY